MYTYLNFNVMKKSVMHIGTDKSDCWRDSYDNHWPIRTFLIQFVYLWLETSWDPRICYDKDTQDIMQSNYK